MSEEVVTKLKQKLLSLSAFIMYLYDPCFFLPYQNVEKRLKKLRFFFDNLTPSFFRHLDFRQIDRTPVLVVSVRILKN